MSDYYYNIGGGTDTQRPSAKIRLLSFQIWDAADVLASACTPTPLKGRKHMAKTTQTLKIDTFAQMVDIVRSLEIKSRVAVVEAQDNHTLESVVQARRDGLVEPILIGNMAKIKEILKEQHSSPEGIEMVASDGPEDSMAKAARMVHENTADIIMKGGLETSQLMSGILDKKNDLKKGGLMSLIGFYEISTYHKIFAVSDVGMNTYPNLDAKRDILCNAVDVLHAAGIINPKVAVLSAIEKVNPKMPDTLDGAALKKMNESGEIGGCIVEAPISFDLAISKSAALVKDYNSPVAGDADLLLVPDIVSGNILAKSLTGLAGAQTAGLAVGAKVPIILTSRSAEASDKYYSIALAGFTAKYYRD